MNFFEESLEEALPKKLPRSIEDIQEPKKHIDPSLAARLEKKHVSPSKSPKNELKKYKIKLAEFKDEESGFDKLALEEVFPKKSPRAVEILDPPRKQIDPALASRLSGAAA